MKARENSHDERCVAEFIAAVAQTLGHSTEIVGDGERAIQASRIETFGLVLIDAHMPGMAGAEALRQIRAERPNVPAILMSGDHDLEGGVLRKPFRLDDLLKRITAVARSA